MEFLKRLFKAGSCFVLVVTSLVLAGIPENEAKFQTISIIYFWGFVFYFLHPYMPFIAIMETFPQRGLQENNVHGVAWRFLAWLAFIIGGLCWYFW
ncbi:MAG: hypothetical protein ACMZ64_06685 [Oleiphilus sp.]